jgi:hypothetical protein
MIFLQWPNQWIISSQLGEKIKFGIKENSKIAENSK